MPVKAWIKQMRDKDGIEQKDIEFQYPSSALCHLYLTLFSLPPALCYIEGYMQ